MAATAGSYTVFLQALVLPACTTEDQQIVPREFSLSPEYEDFCNYCAPSDDAAAKAQAQAQVQVQAEAAKDGDAAAMASAFFTTAAAAAISAAYIGGGNSWRVLREGAMVTKAGVTIAVRHATSWDRAIAPAGHAPPTAYLLDFASAAEYQTLTDYVAATKAAKTAADAAEDAAASLAVSLAAVVHRTYVWSIPYGRWESSTKYAARPLASMVGDAAPAFVARIAEQVRLLMDYGRAHLRAASETVTALDIMLFGPPGTGKSSAVQALATALGGIPIYKVSSAGLKTVSLAETILCPQNAYAPVVIVLVEDADRIGEITAAYSTELSGILNAMSGVATASSDTHTFIVRIFTANNHERLLAVDALASRISPPLRFEFTPVAMLRTDLTTRVEQILHGDDFAAKRAGLRERGFTAALAAAPFTLNLRVVVNFLIAYMFRADAVDAMLAAAPRELGLASLAPVTVPAAASDADDVDVEEEGGGGVGNDVCATCGNKRRKLASAAADGLVDAPTSTDDDAAPTPTDDDDAAADLPDLEEDTSEID